MTAGLQKSRNVVLLQLAIYAGHSLFPCFHTLETHNEVAFPTNSCMQHMG